MRNILSFRNDGWLAGWVGGGEHNTFPLYNTQYTRTELVKLNVSLLLLTSMSSFSWFLFLFCQMRVNKITVCLLSSICQVVRQERGVFFIFRLMLFAQWRFFLLCIMYSNLFYNVYLFLLLYRYIYHACFGQFKKISLMLSLKKFIKLRLFFQFTGGLNKITFCFCLYFVKFPFIFFTSSFCLIMFNVLFYFGK